MAPVIVLIEDSPADTRWFLLQLREAGAMCDVVCFTSGEAALEGLRHMDPPDLIVADWHLPMLGGAELITCAKRIRGLESVPIVVLSGDGHQQDSALKAGALCWLHKPFTADAVERLFSLAQVKS